MWRALFLSSQGRLDASLASFQTASELDPLWFINLMLYSWELAFTCRAARALEVNERAGALRPDVFIPQQGERARILLALGRAAEAADVARFIRKNCDLNPRWHADGVAVWVLRRAGHEQEAADYAAGLFAKWAPGTYRRGFVLGALGRFDAALPYLERTPVVLFRSLYWEEMWAPWRDDPRFRQLLAKLGCAAEYAIARASLARLPEERSG
jgi:tetratricopeptide (TPR) repeat protein